MNPSDLLTDQQKAQIAEQRLQQFAAEAFSHELNRAAILAADPEAETPTEDAAIEHLTKAVASILDTAQTLDVEGFETLTKAREHSEPVKAKNR